MADAWTRDGLLHRWRTSVVAAQALTIEPDWTPRPQLKEAFGNGWMRTATALPTQTGTGTITWRDGSVVTVRTIDAQTAYDATLNPRTGRCPRPDGHSPGCDWLTVTGAHRVTATLRTARGPVEVPAWSFSLEGLQQPLVRVAVDAVEPGDLEPTELPPIPTRGRRVLLNGQDVVGHTATALTITLGSGACDADLREQVLETADVVVVGGTALGPEPGTICDSSLRLHEVTVPLRQVLGGRPVVDVASGRPLLPSGDRDGVTATE